MMRWPGYPRYRDASALFSIVHAAVPFAMQAMGVLEYSRHHPKPTDRALRRLR
jgi:hypothetical protein